MGGLEPATTYSFGLKAVDNSANTSGQSNVVTITTPAEIILFSDDMESGTNGWTTTGTRAQVTNFSHSATHSWHDSPAGNYPRNVNYYLHCLSGVCQGGQQICDGGVEPDGGEADGGDTSGAAAGCGCSASRGSRGWHGLLALALAFGIGLRRRRR